MLTDEMLEKFINDWTDSYSAGVNKTVFAKDIAELFIAVEGELKFVRAHLSEFTVLHHRLSDMNDELRACYEIQRDLLYRLEKLEEKLK